jgi:hypothetical protein
MKHIYFCIERKCTRTPIEQRQDNMRWAKVAALEKPKEQTHLTDSHSTVHRTEAKPYSIGLDPCTERCRWRRRARTDTALFCLSPPAASVGPAPPVTPKMLSSVSGSRLHPPHPLHETCPERKTRSELEEDEDIAQTEITAENVPYAGSCRAESPSQKSALY